MKKSIIKSGIISTFLFGGIYFYLSNDSEKDLLNDFAFENIEAIAQEENPGENYRCYGHGDINCHGYKVEKAYIGLSFD